MFGWQEIIQQQIITLHQQLPPLGQEEQAPLGQMLQTGVTECLMQQKMLL